MILLYRIITSFLYPLLVILIYARKIFKKEDSLRFKEKIFTSHFNIKKKNNNKLIWFHAASIGEFKSIVPIINELNFNHSKLEFLITTTTLSSSEIAKIELKKITNANHRFLPLDVNFLIKRFIKEWNPDFIFLVDSEIWPNLILNAKKLEIPIALINARITFKTSKRWMMFFNVAEKIFNHFSLCLTSNLETKKFLLNLNVKNVHFFGNLKLINRIKEDQIKSVNEAVLTKKRFWLAASTHGGEDEFCIKTHLLLKKKYPDIISIIAPRHIERAKKIKTLGDSFKLNTQILNRNEKIEEDKEIIIINTFGVLQEYYKFAKSVFIGKSVIKKLKNVGGQNPIDAAKLGCRIYHGPYIYNFEEVYKILENNYISSKIESPEELSYNLVKDLGSTEKKNNQISNEINSLGQKTLANTINEIRKFINEIK
tara:strand:- start:4378 stop:5658 length:1281 start_codon:yes stop_codon:yes gene_type:complete